LHFIPRISEHDRNEPEYPAAKRWDIVEGFAAVVRIGKDTMAIFAFVQRQIASNSGWPRFGHGSTRTLPFW
jgi:hypothetical protein